MQWVKDTSDYKGMTYEGYGPHGVAVFVDTLTDNTTRTVADVVQYLTNSVETWVLPVPLVSLVDHKMCIYFQEERSEWIWKN